MCAILSLYFGTRSPRFSAHTTLFLTRIALSLHSASMPRCRRSRECILLILTTFVFQQVFHEFYFPYHSVPSILTEMAMFSRPEESGSAPFRHYPVEHPRLWTLILCAICYYTRIKGALDSSAAGNDTVGCHAQARWGSRVLRKDRPHEAFCEMFGWYVILSLFRVSFPQLLPLGADAVLACRLSGLET